MTLVNFNTLHPVFGVNYDIGYIGFVIGDGPVSQCISYFESWEALLKLRVTHALVVTGEDQCVEAMMGRGVVVSSLSDYFQSSREDILFRRPKGYTRELGWRIADTASAQVGRKYNELLVAGFAVRGSLFGRLVARLLGPHVPARLNRFLQHPHRWICSELAAHALNAQPEFTGRGILAGSLSTITPQRLFEDRVIFDENPEGRRTRIASRSLAP